VSVDLDSLRAKVNKAKSTPSDVPNIKIKHLNLWISEAKAFYNLNVWDKCYDPKLKFEDYHGKQARLGLDMASHIDLTSIASVFRDSDGSYVVFDKTYIPEETVREKGFSLYENCIASGHLISTKGAAINYKFIEDEVLDHRKKLRIIECLYDPWNSTEMAQNLSDRVEMVKIAMNVGNLSAPMKKLDALMREGKIRHNGSPLLRWCLGNVVAKEDHNGNVFPRKSHEKLKIDPVIAILMALAGWLADEKQESVYEQRGIRSL
jgi:phage terminase large subunit-like protein